MLFVVLICFNVQERLGYRKSTFSVLIYSLFFVATVSPFPPLGIIKFTSNPLCLDGLSSMHQDNSDSGKKVHSALFLLSWTFRLSLYCPEVFIHSALQHHDCILRMAGLYRNGVWQLVLHSPNYRHYNKFPLHTDVSSAVGFCRVSLWWTKTWNMQLKTVNNTLVLFLDQMIK